MLLQRPPLSLATKSYSTSTAGVTDIRELEESEYIELREYIDDSESDYR